MTLRQIVKYKRRSTPPVEEKTPAIEQVEIIPTPSTTKNKPLKKKENMDEKVSKAEEIMTNMKAAGNVKIVKKDKGLIERTESSKIVLTEDNRQVLND